MKITLTKELRESLAIAHRLGTVLDPLPEEVVLTKTRAMGKSTTIGNAMLAEALKAKKVKRGERRRTKR
jgi:hypothetical protein